MLIFSNIGRRKAVREMAEEESVQVVELEEVLSYLKSAPGKGKAKMV